MNWQTKKLGEICDFEGGSQPPKRNFIFRPQKGYVRFLQIRDFGSDKNITYIPESKKNRLCSENDILLGRYGASVGKILINKKGAYNVAVMKTLPNVKIVNLKYFYYYLISDEFQNRLSKVASRSAQAGFSKDDIYNFPVLTPHRIEQKRIVKILDEVFENVNKAKENTEKNLQNSKELFKTYLNDIFKVESDNWLNKKLNEVCDFKSGTTISPLLEKQSGDILYVKVGDMNMMGNEIEIKNSSRFVNHGDINISQIIPVGSIIFPKRGGAIFTNKRRKIIKPTIVDLNTMALIPNKYINPDLLYYWFLRINLRDLNNGSSIPQINNYSFDDTFINYPNSIQEQKEIVKKLDQLSVQTKKLEENYKQKLLLLDELKKSVLQKALSGNL